MSRLPSFPREQFTLSDRLSQSQPSFLLPITWLSCVFGDYHALLTRIADRQLHARMSINQKEVLSREK